MVPAQHVPLRDVDYRGLGGHSKDQGTSSVPQEHTWDTCSESMRYLKTQHAITCASPKCSKEKFDDLVLDERIDTTLISVH